MSIDLALEIAQHNAVTARLPEAGEFGRIADLLKVVVAERDPNAHWLTLAHGICTNAGIAQGHISERLLILFDSMACSNFSVVKRQDPLLWLADKLAATKEVKS